MKHVYLSFFFLFCLTGYAVAQTSQDTVPPQVTPPAPTTQPAPTSTPAVASTPVASSQPTPSYAGTRTTERPISYSGGYGHFFTGVGWIEPKDLISHLQSPDVLGSTFQWTNAGVNTGIEGFAEIHNLIVGGGGYVMYIQNMESDGATTRFSFGGGYAKVGYVVYQKPRYFLSVNGGFGGGVMYLGIENTSEDKPIYFSSNIPVFPKQDKDYFHPYLLYDLSVSNKLIATYIDNNRRKYGGLMFGLDLGASFGLPIDTWRDDHGSVSGIPTPGDVINPYIRLTIGGGGFRKHMPVQN